MVESINSGASIPMVLTSLKQLALGGVANRHERAAMNRRRAEFGERSEMIRRAIALVARETIAGKLAFIVEHHPVARHLGNYRRCRDTKALTIATDDLCLWQFKSGNQPPVDWRIVGSPDDRPKCSLARPHRVPININ